MKHLSIGSHTKLPINTVYYCKVDNLTQQLKDIDTPSAYAVVKNETAISGISVYSLYDGVWKHPPTIRC